jgi:hypothetical protein
MLPKRARRSRPSRYSASGESCTTSSISAWRAPPRVAGAAGMRSSSLPCAWARGLVGWFGQVRAAAEGARATSGGGRCEGDVGRRANSRGEAEQGGAVAEDGSGKGRSRVDLGQLTAGVVEGPGAFDWPQFPPRVNRASRLHHPRRRRRATHPCLLSSVGLPSSAHLHTPWRLLPRPAHSLCRLLPCGFLSSGIALKMV